MQNQFLTEEPAPAYVPFAAPTGDLLEADATTQHFDVQAVTALLDATKRKIRRRNVKYWTASAFVQVINVSMQVLVHYLHAPVRQSTAGDLLILFFVITEVVAGIALLYALNSPVDFDVNELARLGGVGAVPLLLDSVRVGRTQKARQALFRALTTLLPQMKASDANLLTTAHRRYLNTMLKLEMRPCLGKRKEDGFAVAILKAYDQVGDAKAIPIVEKLANDRGNSERRREIQRAAQDCLPLLQTHLGELSTTQTLLRASSPSTSAPDVLLRPVGEAAPVPAGELLRAADTSSAE